MEPKELEALQETMAGEYPQGKLNEHDEGALAMAIGTENGKVVIQFGEPTAWVGLDPQMAVDMAQLLIRHARSLGQPVTMRF